MMNSARLAKVPVFAMLVVLTFLVSPSHAITDTVFVQKRITDTVYVVSPPDTVYMQESVVRENVSASGSTVAKPYEENPFVTSYETDTIPPAINVYMSYLLFSDPLFLAFGFIGFDIDIEKENLYYGSIVFNLQSMMNLFDFTLSGEDPEWSGYRSVWSFNVGYRHYFLSKSRMVVNSNRLPVKHRNIPLNNASGYIQGSAGPTIKFAYDGPCDSDSKSSSFNAGFSVGGTAGFIMNSSNTLWGYGITVGYQYWPKGVSSYLLMDDEKIRLVLVNGMTSTGTFVKMELKFGF